MSQIAKAKEFTQSPIVRVMVGPEKHNFLIHKSLLLAQGGFFEACLSQNFKEGTDNLVALPDDEVDAFEVIIEWVYTGCVAKIRNSRQVDVLIKAYMMAHKFLMFPLKNEIMNVLRVWSRNHEPSIQLVRNLELFGVEEDVPLVRFFVDLTAYTMLTRPQHYQHTGSVEPEPSYSDMFTKGGLMAAAIMKSVLKYSYMRGSRPKDFASPASLADSHYHDHPANDQNPLPKGSGLDDDYEDDMDEMTDDESDDETDNETDDLTDDEMVG